MKRQMDKLLDSPKQARVKRGVEKIGGKKITIEREDRIAYALDMPFTEMTVGLYNFIERRKDLMEDDYENMKMYYGHVDGLGYFVAEDEITFENDEIKATTFKLKDMLKFNRRLGNNYFILYYAENMENLKSKIFDWELLDTKTNNDILISGVNSDEELIKFVKDHRRYTLSSVIFFNLALSLILCFMNLINALFFNWNNIRLACCGALLVLIVVDVAISIMSNKNWKVRCREISEEHKNFLKELYEEKERNI